MSAVVPNPTDRIGRPFADLRISVTDRCNFRCTYCMPREAFGASYRFLPRSEILTFEEIERVAGIFARLGARKLRLTGGEPLLRHDLPGLVRRLATATRLDLALTTNGSLLARHARVLRDSGLRRVGKINLFPGLPERCYCDYRLEITNYYPSYQQTLRIGWFCPNLPDFLTTR